MVATGGHPRLMLQQSRYFLTLARLDWGFAVGLRLVGFALLRLAVWDGFTCELFCTACTFGLW